MDDATLSSINFEGSNAFGNAPKVYVFELTVTDSYLKGNPPELVSYTHSDLVSAIISCEQNEGPNSPDPVDLIVEGDGVIDTVDDIDYDANSSYWGVPHDGDPSTDTITTDIPIII